jgi:ABC-type multidrug transport system fused ATPase/permease subunit
MGFRSFVSLLCSMLQRRAVILDLTICSNYGKLRSFESFHYRKENFGLIFGTLFPILEPLYVYRVATEDRSDSVSESQGENDSYTWMYGGLCGALFLLGFCKILTLFQVLIRSSRHLHQRMLNAVIRAPMNFFETNSSGKW